MQQRKDRSEALKAMCDAKGAYLNLVVDAANWKMPINALVEVPEGVATDELMDAINDAIRYFCGGGASFSCDTRATPKVIHVTAPGYYKIIGA